MSIVRVGLAETKNFSDGYDAIFGKKKSAAPASASKDKTPKPAAKAPAKKTKKK